MPHIFYVFIKTIHALLCMHAVVACIITPISKAVLPSIVGKPLMVENLQFLTHQL